MRKKAKAAAMLPAFALAAVLAASAAMLAGCEMPPGPQAAGTGTAAGEAAGEATGTQPDAGAPGQEALAAWQEEELPPPAGTEAREAAEALLEKPAAVEDSEIEPITQFGDEGVEFVSDEGHIIYQVADREYHVLTLNGNEIVAHTSYYDCGDPETAVKYLQVKKAAGAYGWPEIRELYSRNQYCVTDYKPTEWAGLTAAQAEEIYADYIIWPGGE